MKKMVCRKIRFCFPCLLALAILLPAAAAAQPDTTVSGPPPIAAPLVREGDLAIRLVAGLGLATAGDDAEAENRLADAGISPANGWIADYPVTPDIVGELQQAIGSAADAGKLPFGREEALGKFNDVLAASGLSVTPYSASSVGGALPADSEHYPNPAVVNDYYSSDGPPVMTYYVPPPDFYYLYSWVPFPFWCSGFWFPGFFVLHDFHRTIIVNRRPVYVSNHFRDVRDHRVFRIDPVARFERKTFGGIGASQSRGRLTTGVPRSEQRIFNSPPPRNFSRPPVTPQPPSTNRMAVPPSLRGGPTSVPNAPRVRSMPSPAAGGTSLPASRGTMAAPPSHGGETAHPSAARGGEAAAPSVSHGGGGSAGRGRPR